MSAKAYETAKEQLRATPARWLVTGCAGFIGSHLVETLLSLDQTVVGLDNFATGYRHNLEDVQRCVGEGAWGRFTFIHGDIRDLADCRQAVEGVDHVLHQAALGSVPRSLEDPIATNRSNIDGFLNMLVAARDAEVSSFTYAASSSTYGDSQELPKVEERIGKPLSPYAVTKYVNELYADVFQRCYGFDTVGLRYFNIFGPRQDPNGAYAAVIPRWIGAMLEGKAVFINGDGETSRDFTFVDNAVQANLLAALAPKEARNRIYNMACGERTTLNGLFDALAGAIDRQVGWAVPRPKYRDFRAGDVRHSLASIEAAAERLGYNPAVPVTEGLARTVDWFCERRD
ncbi:MAG: SDR family oxidoreductase, partial [Xanthomonadales bacterium]|nr:SDR family oxidoreductase [Xanthomonadales bacterium]